MWEMLRIWHEGCEVLDGYCVVELLGENVASAAEDQVVWINDEVGICPVEMDSGDTSWCNRKRLFWPSFDLELEQPDVHVLKKTHWDKVTLITPLKPYAEWLDTGALFPGAPGPFRL